MSDDTILNSKMTQRAKGPRKTLNNTVVSDIRMLPVDDVSIQENFNILLDKVNELITISTNPVKEHQLYRTNHHTRADFTGKIGQFRIKETSSTKTPEKIEICGKNGWNRLSSRFTSSAVRQLKIDTLNAVDAVAGTPTKAEFDKVVVDLGNIKEKLNTLIDVLSNVESFRLEPIKDEHVDLDYKSISKKIVRE